jgi:hypothetical protein
MPRKWRQTLDPHTECCNLTNKQRIRAADGANFKAKRFGRYVPEIGRSTPDLARPPASPIRKETLSPLLVRVWVHHPRQSTQP